MIEGIKTISNRNMFDDIINMFFINNKTYIKTKNENTEVKFSSSKGGLIKVKFPASADVPRECLAISKQKNNLIYAQLRFIEKLEEDIYLFNSMKFQILSDLRKHARGAVSKSLGDKKVIFITNIVSDFIIQNSLNMGEDKVSRVKEKIIFDMDKTFKYLKIFFSNENVDDPRMKYFYNTRNSFFIPENNKRLVSNNEMYNYYKKNIYENDTFLKKRKDLISEISVPIFYKAMIPYGYIQVNNSTALSTTSLKVVQRVAKSAEELAEYLKLFSAFEERFLVSDVSENGLGIVFKDKNLIQYYKQNSYVFLDMILPKNKKASILADVKYLDTLDNKTIKVGFGIKDMDQLSMTNYNQFLEFTNNP